jgi:hypothetical protein
MIIPKIQIHLLIVSTDETTKEGDAATQKQIADGNSAVQKVEVGLAEVKAEIKGIQTQLSDIKADQRQQDNRFFTLLMFIITSIASIAAKLAKLY